MKIIQGVQVDGVFYQEADKVKIITDSTEFKKEITSRIEFINEDGIEVVGVLSMIKWEYIKSINLI